MSVMSMNSRMAMAEKLSVPQLQQAIQSGSLPAYIGIPLIEQKTREKSQMAAAQQGQQKPPSVASQVLQQADEQEQGIDQLPSNLPIEGAPQGMADGGIVAFADRGLVEGQDPMVSPAVSQYGGIQAMSPEGAAKFAEYEGLLKDLRGKGGSEREQAKAMAIFQAGLGMMGGTSPNAFANIAAGAMPAVTQYQSALKDIRKEDRDTLKQLLDLGVSKEQFLQKAQQMGIDVYKADKAYDAQIRAAGMRASAEKQPRAVTTAELDEREVTRAANLLIQQNPNMSREQAESQAYREVLKIRNPDPSNLTGIPPILIAKNNYVLNAKKPAQEALATAMRTGDPKRIEDAKAALKTAEATASAQFDAYFSGIGAQSNLFNPGGSATPSPAAGSVTPTGAGAAPKIPPGATPNADGTFNFPGNAKVPKGTYKMNPDGTITRVK
jgi:hypothetical protein